MQTNTNANTSLLNSRFDLATAGGLGIFAFLFFSVFKINAGSELFLRLVSIGSNLVNHPHYMATYFRAYANWNNIKEYFASTLIAPIILLIGAYACFVYPLSWAPIFIKAYFVTSGYHYSGQTYGISLIYLNKNNIQFSGLSKFILSFFIYSSYVYNLCHLESKTANPSTIEGIAMQPLGLPAESVIFSTYLISFAFVLYLGLNYYLYKVQNKVLPTIVQIVVFSQIIWFVIGAYNEAFVMFVPFFHSLQYLLVTFYANFRKQFNGIVYSMKSLGEFFWTMDFIKYYRLLVILGMIFFVGIPFAINQLSGANFLFSSVVISAFMNLHHFIVDGEIWKLRKPVISKEIFENLAV
jgi:hypothetical protein